MRTVKLPTRSATVNANDLPISSDVPMINTAPAVPWDPAELQGRDCGHCACFFEQANPENPKQRQGFCRRQPADMAELRVMEQRVINGVPQCKDGKPVMQPGKVVGFLYKPTKREGTCFDGWRPIGALPGDRIVDFQMRQAVHLLPSVLSDLPKPSAAALSAVLTVFGISLPRAPEGEVN